MSNTKKGKITDLEFDDKNFNLGSEYGAKLLDNSFSKFGAGRSVLVDKNNRLIAGNKSAEMFGQLGNENIIIVETTGDELVVVKRTDIDLDSQQGREMALADNQVSKINFVLAEEVLAETLTAEVCEAWGVKFENEIKEIASEDEFDGLQPSEPISVLGDLYEIGEHRLLCGNSTDSDQVAKLMNGQKADMVFTDPPYEIDFNYSNTLLFSENCHVFIFNNDRALIRQLQESPLEFKKFFVFYHSGTAIPQEGGNEIFLDHVLVSHEINGKPKVRYNKGNGTRSVIKGEYRRAEEHKHQKPVSFLSPIIEGYSNKGFKILDFFAGGGSMFSLSHQLKRKCYGIELDPKYCDVIVSRMIKLDDTLTIKRNGQLLSKSEIEKFTENTSNK